MAKNIKKIAKDDNEYYLIINQILDNDEFKKVGECIHHGTTRLEHSLRVSYYSYKITKKLNWDYKSTARAGLMHDFFYNKNGGMTVDGIKSTFTHNKVALNNSLKYFDLNYKEKDIIEKHMFPINIKPPRYKESFVVSIVDKIVGFKEFNIKFKNKALIWLILLLRI
jgi:uncharacterized protein